MGAFQSGPAHSLRRRPLARARVTRCEKGSVAPIVVIASECVRLTLRTDRDLNSLTDVHSGHKPNYLSIPHMPAISPSHAQANAQSLFTSLAQLPKPPCQESSLPT